ncbi:CPBP family intramembrane glutamic endopeptidase [Granulicoccus sp. GXG6511]|uniref:CPBP family intramembrane glutamic endopeptidase n=1 Tax=Granulicoccus sp. GXG6511 TaxID=3381351 RepID=UPI003D7CCFC9
MLMVAKGSAREAVPRGRVVRPARLPGWGIPALRPDGLGVDAPEDLRGWGHPLVRLLVFFVVGGTIGVLGLGLAYLVDPTGPAEGAGMLVTALGLIVAALVGYLVMTVVLERRYPVELDPRRISGLAGGLGVGALLVGICAAIAWAAGGLTVAGVRPIGDIPWVTDFIMTGLFAAVVEEILFRGIVYRFLEQWLGSWLAVGASAVIFGSVHAFAAQATLVSTIATIIEAGLLFAVVYLLTRSLWWVIGLHAAWNSVLSNVVGVPVSGNVNEGLLITAAAGPDLISGGAYGLEASIITVLVLTPVALMALFVAHRRGVMVAPSWVRRRRVSA